MTTHFHLIFWALRVAWGFPNDRLRLWWKSVNLYLSLLAFTDEIRPPKQLRQAMICAVITAIWDFDTDWPRGDRKGTNVRQLLDQYVDSDRAYRIATELLATEQSQTLSKDGLERGSVALYFYCLLIDGHWMRAYSVAEIKVFGWFLQIIDDVLDFEKDRMAGDKNCLLLGHSSETYIRVAREFMASEFFLKLQQNSFVYRVLAKKVTRKLDRIEGQTVALRQLLGQGRPTTAIYAALLTIIGFGFYQNATPIAVSLPTALAFAGLTTSIMLFNNLVDRWHDRKKGKTFASKHGKKLKHYWWAVNVITGLCLAAVAWQDAWTALLCLLVWTMGILYSYIPRWYLINNLVVAVCSGSPVLAAMVYYHQPSYAAIMTFLVFASLILYNEIYKDAEDIKVDAGYKATLPVQIGYIPTFGHLIGLLVIPATLLAVHPNPWIGRFALAVMPLVAFQQGMVFMHPERINRLMATMRWVLTGLLLILLAS